MNCRYCNNPLLDFEKAAKTLGYWNQFPFDCHPECKVAGERQEAIDCQVIDADCNDCKHFQRGEVVKKLLSCMDGGKAGMRLVNMGTVNGKCLKFSRPTQAYPHMWTGRECFEHRRINTTRL